MNHVGSIDFFVRTLHFPWSYTHWFTLLSSIIHIFTILCWSFFIRFISFYLFLIHLLNSSSFYFYPIPLTTHEKFVKSKFLFSILNYSQIRDFINQFLPYPSSCFDHDWFHSCSSMCLISLLLKMNMRNQYQALRKVVVDNQLIISSSFLCTHQAFITYNILILFVFEANLNQ